MAPLPAAYHDTLDAGLEALGVQLSAAARAAIDGHVQLLLAWNAAINLTSIVEPGQIARVHVLDSLAAVPLLDGLGARRLLDVGSGGGFPGLPLAAAIGAERALLVDSVGKKARFLTTVIEALGLTATVAAEQTRAETLARDPRDRERWPVVTARAVAPLVDLVEVALPLVAPGGLFIAWKGASAEAELAAAGPVLNALGAGSARMVEACVPGLDDHRLVVVRKDRAVDPRFPRDPAERRRRPV